MTSPRVVTVCSTIPKLAAHIQKVCGSSTVLVNIDPPEVLDKTICSKTDFLIADAGFVEPLLTLRDFERLKFVQSTWAGIDSLARKVKEDNLSPSLRLARLSHDNFSQLMAEYALAAVINMERNVKKMMSNQANKSWDKGDDVVGYRCLNQLKVGVLGMGQMGAGVAKAFSAFGTEVCGFVSRAREPTDLVKAFYTLDNLNDMLGNVDYLVNVLPATPNTNNLLSRERLKHCNNVGFVNIGRGNIIDEEDTIFALEKGFFKAAFLDVFNQEPLPAESPLWSHENVTITPHVAGESRAEDIAQCFKSNVDKFEAGLEPDCLVKWDMLY